MRDVSAQDLLTTKLCSFQACDQDAEVGDRCLQHAEPQNGTRRDGRIERGQGPTPHWTMATIADAIRAYGELHEGSPPTYNEWENAGPDHPSANTVTRAFGSWAAAIQFAGFEPRSRGGQEGAVRVSSRWTPPEGGFTQEQAFDAIREFIAEHDRPPLASEWQKARSQRGDWPSYDQVFRATDTSLNDWRAIIGAAIVAVPDPVPAESDAGEAVPTAESARAPDPLPDPAPGSQAEGGAGQPSEPEPADTGAVADGEEQRRRPVPSTPESGSDDIHWTTEQHAQELFDLGEESSRLLLEHFRLGDQLAGVSNRLEDVLARLRFVTDEWIRQELGGDHLGEHPAERRRVIFDHDAPRKCPTGPHDPNEHRAH